MLDAAPTLLDTAHDAASYGGVYVDVLHYLIDQAHIPVPNNVFINMGHTIVSDIGVFDYLLTHGADVNAVNSNNLDVIRLHPRLSRYWADSGYVPNPSSEYILPLLMYLYEHLGVESSRSVIKMLRIDVNARDAGGDALIHHVCRTLDTSLLPLLDKLLELGANINAVNSNGETPIQLLDIHDRGCLKLLKYLYMNGLETTAKEINRFVPLAIDEYDNDMLNRLLNNGADANAVYDDGRSPLLCVIQRDWMNDKSVTPVRATTVRHC